MISPDTGVSLNDGGTHNAFVNSKVRLQPSYQVTVYAIWILIMIPPDTEFHRMMKAPTKLFVNYKFKLQLHIWMYSTMSRLSGDHLGSIEMTYQFCSIEFLTAIAARNRQLSFQNPENSNSRNLCDEHQLTIFD